MHRLFVCIAGVADQLQTNFAADLRQILRSVFMINSSPPEEEVELIDDKNGKDNPTDLFEFRASENDVIHQSDGSSNGIGSQQSICSAEEVNPESDDTVFEDEEDEQLAREATTRGERSASLNIEPNRISSSSSEDSDRYAHHESENSISLCEETEEANERLSSPSNERISESLPESSRPSIPSIMVPPKWVPDNEASRCMNCDVQFTHFKRKHHCRSCGQIFCSHCSADSIPLPKFGFKKAVRVCRLCFAKEVAA